MARPRKTLNNMTGNITKEQILRFERVESKLDSFSRNELIPPEHLNEVATNEFRRILPLLSDYPLCNLDLATICGYCSFYADYVQASSLMKEQGMFLPNDEVHPAYKLKEKASIRMEQLGKKLFMDVASRSNYNNEVIEEDKFKQFLEK